MIAGVPYDAEVEYLESTGTQWIEVPFVINDINDDLYVKAHLAFTTFGSTNNDPSPMRFMSNSNSTATAFGIGWNATYFWSMSKTRRYMVFPTSGFNTRQKLEVVIANYQCSVDGHALSTENGNAPAFQKTTIFRGFRGPSNALGSILYDAYARSPYSEMDLISVRVGQVGYMYDRVTRKLFGNKGTGAFIIGPDVATPVMGLRKYPQIGGAA